MYINAWTCPLTGCKSLDFGNAVYGSALHYLAGSYPPHDGLHALTNRESAGDVVEALLGIMYLYRHYVLCDRVPTTLNARMRDAFPDDYSTHRGPSWDQAMTWASAEWAPRIATYEYWLEQTLRCVYAVIEHKGWWHVHCCRCAMLIDDLRIGRPL